MRKRFLLLACAGVLLLPGDGWAQAAPLSPLGSFWLAPYLGVGFQGEYHDAIVVFADGDRELLRLDPGTAIAYGVQVGYRTGMAWTVHANLSHSVPEARYVENNNVRPNVDLKTTQLELGLLYDLSTFPIADKIAPFFIGGGLSLTFHSFDPFRWDDEFIEPSSTSIGVHGLAVLDIPLAPKVSLRGQAKLTASSLALGDLNDKIAFAEGTAIVNSLDGGIATYFVLSAGLTFRL